MDDTIQKLQQTVNGLKQELTTLKQARVYQQDISPQSVKNRHMGEANSYIYNVITDLTTNGHSVEIGTQIFYQESAKTQVLWNSTTSVWDYFGSRTTTETLTNKTLTKPIFQSSTGSVGTATYASTVNFSMATVNYWLLTLTGNCTFTVSNVAVGDVFTLDITNNGSSTVTWFSTIAWSNATPPTLTTTANRIDTFLFKCVAANTFRGMQILQAAG